MSRQKYDGLPYDTEMVYLIQEGRQIEVKNGID
jgi:hypothetical protein